MDGYYVSSNLPEVFKIADAIVAKEFKSPKFVRQTVEEDMPEIKSSPNIDGPMHVTQEWYDKQKEKKARKREKQKKEMEVEMIQLIARQDMLRRKLKGLDPGKKKDSKKIADINIQLKTISTDLKMLETQSGIHIDELENGTKLGRFVENIKRKIKKTAKKFKKFCKRNSELVFGICSIVLPVIGSFIGKLIFK